MAISPRHQQLANQFGVSQGVLSDEEFERQLDNLNRHRALIMKAKEIGVEIQFGMTSAALRDAYRAQQVQLLTARGFVPDAVIRIDQRSYRRTITGVFDPGTGEEVTVVHDVVRADLPEGKKVSGLIGTRDKALTILNRATLIK